MLSALTLILSLAGDLVVENTGVDVSSFRRSVHQSGPWTVYVDSFYGRLRVRDARTGRTDDLGVPVASTVVFSQPNRWYQHLDVADRWVVCGRWEFVGAALLQSVLVVHDLELGTTVEPGIPCRLAAVDGDLWLDRQGSRFVLIAPEDEIEDLNGDGDLRDELIYVYDAELDQLVDLGVTFHGGFDAQLDGTSLLVATSELDQGQDLNGDGHLTGEELFRYELDTGVWLPLATPGRPLFSYPAFEGPQQLIRLQETTTDLNGDGDVEPSDLVAHGFDPSGRPTVNLGLDVLGSFPTANLIEADGWCAFIAFLEGDPDFDGQTPDPRIFLYDARAREVVATGLESASLAGAWTTEDGDRRLLFRVSEKDQLTDFNGDGDAKDNVPGIWSERDQAFRTLPFAMPDPKLDGTVVVGLVGEKAQGVDLNGDGQLAGTSWVRVDVTTGASGVVGGVVGFGGWVFQDQRRLWFLEAESQTADLNGDGDTQDLVLFGATPGRLDAVNTGLAAGPGTILAPAQRAFDGGWAAFTVSEVDQGLQDLNGDGDVYDRLLHVAH